MSPVRSPLLHLSGRSRPARHLCVEIQITRSFLLKFYYFLQIVNRDLQLLSNMAMRQSGKALQDETSVDRCALEKHVLAKIGRTAFLNSCCEARIMTIAYKQMEKTRIAVDDRSNRGSSGGRRSVFFLAAYRWDEGFFITTLNARYVRKTMSIIFCMTLHYDTFAHIYIYIYYY